MNDGIDWLDNLLVVHDVAMDVESDSFCHGWWISWIHQLGYCLDRFRRQDDLHILWCVALQPTRPDDFVYFGVVCRVRYVRQQVKPSL